MQTMIRKILNNLQKEGRYLEVHLQESVPTLIQIAKGEMEALSTSQFFSGNIRVYEKGYWNTYAFNHRELERIPSEIEAVLAGLSILSGKKTKLLAAPTIKEFLVSPVLIDPQKVSLSEKVELLLAYDNILRKESAITTTRSVYKDIWKKTYFLNSEGSEIVQEKQFTGMSLYAMCREGKEVQQAFFSQAGYGGLELVQGYEEQAQEISGRARQLLGAKTVEKGKYQVILDPRLAGVFAHEAFGHLSEADFVFENQGMREMMSLGKEFGGPDLNIIDDGSLEGLAGYTPYDDEGVKGRRNYLIKEGKLAGRMHSRETAAAMEEGLTGNARALGPLYAPLVRMTNTFIDNGEYSPQELFERVEDGIYCQDYIGGMTNLEMFTFTAGRAYRIKNGKIQELLKDVVLSGNVFETLKKVRMIGNDLAHFGTLGGCGKGGQSGLPVTVGAPHLLLEDILIG